MSLISQDQGIVSFALGEPEELTVIIQPEKYIVNINNCDFWWFQTGTLKEIRVQHLQEQSFSPSHHQLWLEQMLARLGLTTGYAVDIGAHDGRNHSNTFQLFCQGWRGLAAECNPYRFARLAKAYEVLPQVELVRSWVTPENLLPLLQAYEVPQQFDFLSLDIDSYDYHILAELLTSYRPILINCEINEVLPPPLRFTLNAGMDSDLSRRFYGQSLALLDDLARQHDYAILHMHYMDAFLIDKRRFPVETPDLAGIYRRGLLDLPVPDYYRDYPFDVHALWQASPQEAYEMVKTGFAPYAGQFELSLGPLPERG